MGVKGDGKTMTTLLAMIGGIVFLFNVPFGYWRANVEPLSRQWFLAVHLPVPFIIVLRLASHLGWHLQTFLVLIGFFSAGQFLGGRIHRSMRRRSKRPPSSCLVMDLTRRIKDS